MAERAGGSSAIRTHTCGALRAGRRRRRTSSCSAGCTAIRDLGSLLFIDIRDRYGLTQVVAATTTACSTRAKRLKTEYVVAVIGTVERRSADTINPKLPPATSKCVAREIRVLSEAKTAALPDRRRGAASRGDRACGTATSTCASRGCSRTSCCGTGSRWRSASTSTAQGFVGDRDADPRQEHARGRARLPGAEPRAPRRVLRAAAVAADLQADPDDRGHGSLLPDRAVLPRRGPARRPPARVHAGGRRDLVRDAGTRLRSDRAGMAGDLRARSASTSQRPFPRMSYAEAMAQLRVRQARPAVRPADPRTRDRVRRAAFGAVPRGARQRRAWCAGSSCPGAGTCSRREIDELVEQAKQLGARGLIWVRRSAEGALQSSALKAVGEEALAAWLRRRRRRPHDLLILAAGAPDATSKLLGPDAPRRSASGRADDARPVRLHLGRRLPAARVGRRRSGASCSMHHPFTSPVDEDMAADGHRPGQRAREGVRPRAERQRNRRRQHQDPRPRRCRRGSSGC